MVLPDHHDVELMDVAGKVLAERRLPEDVAGIAELHELIGRYLPEDATEAGVVVGIEADRGPLGGRADRGRVRGIPGEPRCRPRGTGTTRHGVSGAKSDRGDAHMLADMVRTDSYQLRPAARTARRGASAHRQVQQRRCHRL
jgi:hypothetical protein